MKEKCNHYIYRSYYTSIPDRALLRQEFVYNVLWFMMFDMLIFLFSTIDPPGYSGYKYGFHFLNVKK